MMSTINQTFWTLRRCLKLVVCSCISILQATYKTICFAHQNWQITTSCRMHLQWHVVHKNARCTKLCKRPYVWWKKKLFLSFLFIGVTLFFLTKICIDLYFESIHCYNLLVFWSKSDNAKLSLLEDYSSLFSRVGLSIHSNLYS